MVVQGKSLMRKVNFIINFKILSFIFLYFLYTGRKVDGDGNLIDEKDKEEAEREGDTGSSSEGGTNVFECGECGYTLFVAQGREFKFFPESFTCPECGATKDKFNKNE